MSSLGTSDIAKMSSAAIALFQGVMVVACGRDQVAKKSPKASVKLSHRIDATSIADRLAVTISNPTSTVAIRDDSLCSHANTEPRSHILSTRLA